MQNIRNRFCIPSVIMLLFFIVQTTEARQNVQFSFFPGYHVVNSDQASGDSRVGQTNWIFGGNAAFQKTLKNIPLEVVIGYSEGKSTIFETSFTIDFTENYSVDLRYRTVPVEVLWVNNITDRFRLLTGINLAAQHRSLIYYDLDIDDDRLLSFGFGLSGRASLAVREFDDGNGRVFVTLSARWTEFLFHDSNDRHTDDFTYRHVLISPQLGFVYRF